MTAATTRLWVPNLWLPRTEFRLRRTRDATDNRILSGADVGSVAESSILDTGSGPALPRGGLASLRAPQPYPLLPPDATVAAPYGSTQWSAAREAAGDGTAGTPKVIRVPQGASGVTGVTADLTRPYQTWQFEQLGTMIVNSTVNLKASNLRLQGGLYRNSRIWANESGWPLASDITIEDIKWDQLGPAAFGLSAAIVCNTFNLWSNWTLTRLWLHDDGAIIAGDDDNFRQLAIFWHGAAPTQRIFGGSGGVRIQHSVITRAAGHGGNMIGGQDGGGAVRNGIKNFVVHNCDFDGGTPGSIGWFGIEVWGHVRGDTIRSDGLPAGGIVQYSTLRGGHACLSMVGAPTGPDGGTSKNLWIHHNIFDLTEAYSASETGGAESENWLYEDNIVNGTGGVSGTRRGWFAYHNSNSNTHLIRNNKITGLEWAVGGFPDAGGGAYTVQDNCLVNTGTIIPGGWGRANFQSNNGPNGCDF